MNPAFAKVVVDVFADRDGTMPRDVPHVAFAEPCAIPLALGEATIVDSISLGRESSDVDSGVKLCGCRVRPW